MAQEVLNDLDNKSTATLNDELRKSRRDVRDVKSSIETLVSNALSADGTSIKNTANVLSIGNVLGSWSSPGLSGTASTDCLIVAWATPNGTYTWTGTSGGVVRQSITTAANKDVSMCFPVKDGDAWIVNDVGVTHVYLIPLGS
jgi:hypothetical protein